MKKLEVRLRLEPGQERRVGQLAERGRQLFFEYDPEFLRHPLWLSPFKLPPKPGLLEHRDLSFGPIFGLFEDSLPDGWGLLLMDRFFRRKGLALSTVSVLERLSYLGTRTMGALTYHPPAEQSDWNAEVIDLQVLAGAARDVLQGDVAEVLPQLLRVGGSPGGARPKVLVGVRKNDLISGEEDLPEGFEHWMVKFSSEQDPADAGPIELAYSRMARGAGIEMPPTRLFETSRGDRFFGIKRFDRAGNRRIHVHTFGNLIHANFRIPGSDYVDLLKVTQILTRNNRDVTESFRRMVFNVLTHNRDDHVKNFCFRLNEAGEWALAPAYDLIHSSGPGGEHSLTIAGEGRRPTRQHMRRVAESADIPHAEAESIMDAVRVEVFRWRTYAEEAGVSSESRGEIQKAMEGCLSAL